MDNARDNKSKRRKIPGVEFESTLGTDRPGDAERRVGDHIMVAAVSVKFSCLSLLERHKGAPDQHVVQGMLNYIDRLGLV